jgi:two-component system NtrC family sensor kinase
VASRSSNVRLLLALHAAAIAAAFAAVMVVASLPASVRGTLSPRTLLAAVVGAAVLSTLVGSALLFRTVARPVDRLLDAAERLAGSGPADLPFLGDADGSALSRSAVAFARLAAALAQERERLAAKVEELTLANHALAEARESLLRAEKLATIGRLAAGVAHEVGNPLAAITGFVELARAHVRGSPPEELEDYLGRMAAEAQRIDRTVRELLDFARPTPASLVPVDLASAIEASLRLARLQERFRHVQVALDVPAPVPRALADEHGLAQVLVNLFLNAGDAMGGRGELRVSVRTLEPRDPPDEPSRGVVLAVADRGPGIAREDLPRIFDPFFTTKEPGKGTGLGLAICHRIVESFGGRIAAANAAEGGAVFTVLLREAPPLVADPRAA